MLNLEMIIKEVEKILRQAGQRSISCPAVSVGLAVFCIYL